MNDYEKGWISAFIDSEGSLTWHKGGSKKRPIRNPMISIKNSNLAMIIKCQNLVGGKVYYSSQAVNRTMWALQIFAKDWTRWLNDIVLIEKESARGQFLIWQLTKWRFRK